MNERCYSHSKIKTYIDCARLYFWQYVKEIVPIVKPKPLAAGSTIAEALETYRVTGDESATLDTIKSIGTSDENQLVLGLLDDPIRSVGRLTLVMLDYMETYPDEPKKVFKHTYADTERPRVEIEFKVPLTTNGLFYEGRIDGLYKLENNELAIIEDKTTTRMGEKYFDQFQTNFQVMWYMWAANELGAFKNSIPRCIVNAIYLNPKEFRLKRNLIIKSVKQLDQARLDLMQWIELIERSKALNCFPRNLSFCDSWGGCSYKVLRDIEKNSLMDRIIEANFKKKEKR